MYLCNVNNKHLKALQMTATEKIEAWHNGTRKMNLKACSVDKLNLYRKITIQLGYNRELKLIDSRLYELEKDLSKWEIENYIENFKNSEGDSGEDLFKETNGSTTIYSWSATKTESGDCVIDEPDFGVFDTYVYDYNTCTKYPLIGMTQNKLKKILLDSLFEC